MKKQILILTYLILLATLMSAYTGTVYPSYNITSTIGNTISINITSKGNFSYLTLSPNPPYNSLVGYWDFDIATPSIVYDLSSNNNNGTYGDNAYSGNGLYEKSLILDGADDRITIPDSSSLDVKNITISMWIYPTAIGGSRYLISKNKAYHFYLNDQQLKIQFTNASGDFFANTGNEITTTNQWYHLAVTYNGTEEAFYKNGIKVTAYGYLDNAGDLNNSPNNLDIGSLSTTNEFQGCIDEVMIFNSSLNSTQILNIYNNQSPRFVPSGIQEFKQFNLTLINDWVKVTENQTNISGSVLSKRLGEWNVSLGYNNTDFINYDGLISCWRADNTSTDSCGVNNGIFYSTGTRSNYTEGAYYNAFNLDGDADSVRINDAPSINLTGNGISYSAWVYARSINTGGYNVILSKGARNQGFTMDNNWNAWDCEILNQSGSLFYTRTAADPPELNRWTHLACVVNSTHLAIFVDGAFRRSKAINGGVGTVSAKLAIGADTSGGLGFNGTIDEVMIFNRSLSADEIKQLYVGSYKNSAPVPLWSEPPYLTTNNFLVGRRRTNFKITYNFTASPYNFFSPILKVSSVNPIIASDLQTLIFNNYTAENNFAISQFVKANGTNFTLAGVRYTLIGADSYYLADYATNHTYDDNGNEINNSASAVIEILNKAKYLGINVIRTWAGMFGGNTSINYTHWQINQSGGHYNLFLSGNTTNFNETMFRALDYVIYEAGKRDIRLQLVLINNWDAYGGMRWFVQQSPTSSKVGDGTDAFHDQFYNDTGCILAFQNYINYTLNRVNTYSGIQYKNDPAIFAWLLANEPRAKSQGTGRSLIVNWTRNMTTFIKSIDSNHLVGLGIEGFGYNETWGEGTDMIADHNGTGVDFATFELHPDQWNYFANRSETSVDLQCAGLIWPSNDTIDWWTKGSGYSYNTNCPWGTTPAYIPKLARHSYSNWVSQNVNWSETLLKMPVLLQELAVPSIMPKNQKDRFYNQAIYSFYSAGGDGLLLWNLNHDNYYYSTTPDGLMDDGYSFYYSSDPFLRNRSLTEIASFTFVKTNNTGGTSWVTLINNYQYIFYYNISYSHYNIKNCSLWLNITNMSNQSTGYFKDQSNASTVINNSINTFTKMFNSTNREFEWYLQCCDNESLCTETDSSYVLLANQPVITLTIPADNYIFNETYVTLNYTVSDGIGVSSCHLYINGMLNHTNSTITTDIDQSFKVNVSLIPNSYTWRIECIDTGDNTGLSAIRTFIYDVNPLNTTLLAPASGLITSNNTFNFTVYINSTAPIGTINWYLNGALNNTYTVVGSILETTYGFNTTLPDSYYEWYYLIYDIYGLNGISNTRNITIDTTPAAIHLNCPLNNSYWNLTQFNFNWTAIDITSNNMSCNLTIDNVVNASSIFSLNGTATNQTVLGFNDGYHYWNITCKDNLSNIGTSDTYLFLVDTVYPLIDFIYPTPLNNSAQSKTWIYANVSSSDSYDHFVVNNLDNSLVGWWRMDVLNSSGTGVVDESGYGNNGTPVGQATQVTNGKFGKGFSFDSDGDYVKIPNVPADGTGGLSWSVWFKRNTAAAMFVLDQREINVGYQPMYLDTDGHVQFYSSDTGNSNDFNTNLEVGIWYHVVMVLNGSDVLCYVNGSFFGSKADTQADFGAKQLTIGARHSYTITFNGTIDEVLVFNRSLISQEISALYNASASQYYNNFTNLAEGNHTIQSYAVDMAGNVDTTGGREITIDLIPPIINITYPLNTSYTIDVSVLNYMVSDNNKPGVCWYSTSSGIGNSTPIAAGINFTGVSSINGNNTWTVYCNDTAGNLNSTSVTFTRDYTAPISGGVAGAQTGGTSVVEVSIPAEEELAIGECKSNPTFMEKLFSQCTIERDSICQDGEMPLINADCNLTFDDIFKMDFLKHIWFLRLLLLWSTILLIRKSQHFPVSVVAIVTLLVYNGWMVF